MKIEQQVCTLEQAKKLKELLGELYGAFVYMGNKALPSDSRILLSEQTESFKQMGKIEGSAWIKYYPAFTVAELTQMVGSVNIEFDNDRWYARAEIAPTANNLAWCLAELIIYRLENKLTTPEEVNKRLS